MKNGYFLREMGNLKKKFDIKMEKSLNNGDAENQIE